MFADRTKWDLAANKLAEALARHRASGRKWLDLTASNPTECGFEYDREGILGALRNPAALEYHPDPQGLAPARRAVAEYYAGHGTAVALQDIILTASTSEAYSFAFRLLCNPGDDVLAPSPSYPLFDFLAGIHDVRPRPYPLFYDHGWHIDFHALEQAITPRTRGVVVVHPNNPTGHFTKAEEAIRLGQICAARGMAVIVDEVFLDFALFSEITQAEAPRSFAGSSGALTLTMSGLSKICGLPQMKLAWLVVSGPEQMRREALARLEVIADTYLSVSTPIQLAAAELLAQRSGLQTQVMGRVRKNLAELDRQLAAQKNCVRLEVEGGWYAVLRVPVTKSDEEVAIELLEKHDVYVHPGHFYDFAREGFLVVSLITPEEDFARGIEKVLRVADDTTSP